MTLHYMILDKQDDSDLDCPLCMDPLGDDIRFKPCNCGYQVSVSIP